MTVNDRGVTERTLTHVGFQRLSSYWQPFESNTPSNHGNRFVTGTQFRVILSRYLFDQRLRSHMMEAFSFIEVSIRTQWAHQLAHGFGHGNHAHQNPALFNRHHASNLAELQRSYEQITNLKGPNFNSQTIWDVIHVMSFGQLSKWCSNLRDRQIRQAISQTYGIDESLLPSALQRLTAVRNICAHHERLWNVNLYTGLKIPTRLTTRPENARAFNQNALHKVYNATVMTTHLMEVITPNGDWPKSLLQNQGRISKQRARSPYGISCKLENTGFMAETHTGGSVKPARSSSPSTTGSASVRDAQWTAKPRELQGRRRLVRIQPGSEPSTDVGLPRGKRYSENMPSKLSGLILNQGRQNRFSGNEDLHI